MLITVLKVDYLMFLLVAFMLIDNMLKFLSVQCTISSGDRTYIVKYAKGSFWSSFNIFRADFGHISSRLKNLLFQIYCCVFYRSSLWPLEGAMIQSLCVDCRKVWRCMVC